MIERVDVLTGGASAVYGSDAVAGVVNFIMKKDFEGVSVTVPVQLLLARERLRWPRRGEAARHHRGSCGVEPVAVLAARLTP